MLLLFCTPRRCSRVGWCYAVAQCISHCDQWKAQSAIKLLCLTGQPQLKQTLAGTEQSPHIICSMAAVPRLLLLLLGTAALLPCVATLDILQAGSDILANQYLQSGNFYLVMQLDCNLVIYQGVECCSNPTWSTGTWNLGAAGDGCVASMQQDRNFVVYGFVNNVKTALWDTHTDLNNATGAYYVILGNDGSLKVMEIGSPDVIWTNVVETGGAPVPSPPVSTGAPAPSAALAPASQSASNVTFLTPESKVVAGSFLANEDVRLTLELDCNLQSRNVLGGSVVWETGSHTSQGGCELVLQKDSALLIRIQSSGAVIWKSNTKNPKNAVAQFLFLREDGTVAVISTNGEEIWSLGKTDHSPSKSLAGVIVGTTGGILGGIILLGVTLCILMQYGEQCSCCFFGSVYDNKVRASAYSAGVAVLNDDFVEYALMYDNQVISTRTRKSFSYDCWIKEGGLEH